MDPLAHEYPHRPQVSKKTYSIAGILTTVYGQDEVPRDIEQVCCLWLLHPRLSKQAKMEPVAAAALESWNLKLKHESSPRQGLIAVAFDQRNHGSRLIDKVANEAWKTGNPRHAQDMFSIFQGTAADTSQLIEYLPAYVYPENERRIVNHLVLGISLGGHAAWHCILHDPRITAAVIVIGCADYTGLMSQRAQFSKLDTWTSTTPPGKSFVGSKDYPRALVEAVKRYDPTGLVMNSMSKIGSNSLSQHPSDQDLRGLMPLMRDHLRGKRILNQAGGSDKLVPYKCSETFLKWLKHAIGPSGWLKAYGIELTDKVYDGVGHAFSPAMMKDAVAFIVDTIDYNGSGPSKM